MVVERLFLAVPQGCLQFVIVVFPDHTHLLFLNYWPFQGGTSFVDLSCLSVYCMLCLYARLFICALWSPAGKGLASWLSFVVSKCVFVIFPLVS